MLMVVSPKGELKGLAEATRKDMAQKKNYFDINGKAVVVDYSFYSDALKEYKKLEKSAKKSGNNMVQVKKADYLKKYFEGTDTKEISLSEAQDILENKMARTQVTCDGEPLTHQVSVKNQTYLLGTDGLGRDLFIRIVYGARISLLVGFFAAFINFVVGVFYGAIAGYAGGQTDNIMMRIVDVLDSIPMTLYVILIMVVVGPGIVSIILALGLTFWVKMARIVRGQVLTLKQQEFVKAAIVTGADTRRIITKHLIPQHDGSHHGKHRNADSQRHFQRGVPQLRGSWNLGAHGFLGYAVQRRSGRNLCVSVPDGVPGHRHFRNHFDIQPVQRRTQGCL